MTQVTIQWLQTFTFLHVDKFTFAWFQCQWNIFKGDYHVLFAKYYMKLKPQNVLVLSSNCIFTTFHKRYLHSLQSSIIHCSIIVILNHIHFHLIYKAFLHKHKIKRKLSSIYNLSTLLNWCFNIYIDNKRLFLTKSSLSFCFLSAVLMNVLMGLIISCGGIYCHQSDFHQSSSRRGGACSRSGISWK